MSIQRSADNTANRIAYYRLQDKCPSNLSWPATTPIFFCKKWISASTKAIILLSDHIQNSQLKTRLFSSSPKRPRFFILWPLFKTYFINGSIDKLILRICPFFMLLLKFNVSKPTTLAPTPLHPQQTKYRGVSPKKDWQRDPICKYFFKKKSQHINIFFLINSSSTPTTLAPKIYLYKKILIFWPFSKKVFYK